MAYLKSIKLYEVFSYHHPTTIIFGEKNLIVGSNDSGKSSIFKSVKFLLEYITNYDWRMKKPWDNLAESPMVQLEFFLSREEGQFLMDLLSLKYHESDRNMYTFGSFIQADLLLEKLKKVIFTAVWKNNPYENYHDNLILYLEIPNLGIKLCQVGIYGETFVTTEPREQFDYSEKPISFVDFINSNIDFSSFSTESMKQKIPPQEAQAIKIPQIPDPGRIVDQIQRVRTVFAPTKVKINKIFGATKKTPVRGQSFSFFYAFSSLLKNCISLISDQRNFYESVPLTKGDLRDDATNLQSYLFWLHNGENEDNRRYELIKKSFQNIFFGKLSFDVEIIGKDIAQKNASAAPPEEIVPDKATISFYETIKDMPAKHGFQEVGAGVRESLFLLAKCIGQQNNIILLDEPALNLHPLQVRMLFREIFSMNQSLDDKKNQVIIVTHSPILASLEMLSDVNEIIRVTKKLGKSMVTQPSNADKKWISDNLPTFHLLRSDMLFAKSVILVEGPSDRIFLDTIIKTQDSLGLSYDNILVLEVGGNKSFPNFEQFLKMFGIPYLILADNDVQNRFPPSAINIIDSTPIDETKKIYVLREKDLEAFLQRIDTNLFNQISNKYERKQEVAYHFINELLKNGLPPALDPIKILITNAAKTSQY